MEKLEIHTLPELFNSLNTNVLNCFRALKAYDGSDWENYLLTPLEKDKYRKILIHKNDMLDVYIIFWGRNSFTGIHNHPEGGCVAKVIEGELTETQYINTNGKALKFGKNIATRNTVVNRVGSVILHKIENFTWFSASIHIYFPPDFVHNTYEELKMNEDESHL